MTNEPLLLEQTIEYKTYLKSAFVEALTEVFGDHPDDLLRQHTQVQIDLPLEKAGYPAIVIRYYGRSVRNLGVAHQEVLKNPSGAFQQYKHYLYSGTIEFAIYALSSYDRDLVSDALVQTITMSDTEPYTNQFYERIYNSTDPVSYGHFININTDELQEFGETQVIAPWMAEDTLVYQTSHRTNIMGEFYSRILDGGAHPVEKVPVYPYFGPDEGGTDPTPTGDPRDTGEWLTPWQDRFLPLDQQ